MSTPASFKKFVVIDFTSATPRTAARARARATPPAIARTTAPSNSTSQYTSPLPSLPTNIPNIQPTASPYGYTTPGLGGGVGFNSAAIALTPRVPADSAHISVTTAVQSAADQPRRGVYMDLPRTSGSLAAGQYSHAAGALAPEAVAATNMGMDCSLDPQSRSPLKRTFNTTVRICLLACAAHLNLRICGSVYYDYTATQHVLPTPQPRIHAPPRLVLYTILRL